MNGKNARVIRLESTGESRRLVEAVSRGTLGGELSTFRLSDDTLGEIVFTGRVLASASDEGEVVESQAKVYATADGRFVLEVRHEQLQSQVHIYDNLSAMRSDLEWTAYGGIDPMLGALISEAYRKLEVVPVELTVEQWGEVLDSMRTHIYEKERNKFRHGDVDRLCTIKAVIENQVVSA